MTDTFGDGAALPVYAVRLSSLAATQLREEHQRLQALSGPAVADAWEDRLMAALAGLATLPERCVVAPEDDIFPQETLRQLLFRRRPGGPAWRVLFSIREVTAADPPMILVHRIRHAAQVRLTEWPPDEAGLS